MTSTLIKVYENNPKIQSLPAPTKSKLFQFVRIQCARHNPSLEMRGSSHLFAQRTALNSLSYQPFFRIKTKRI